MERPELVLASDLDYARPEERQQALVEAVRRQHLQKQHCVSVLAPDAYRVVQIELADLPDEELRDAARWQIRERIDYPPEEAVIDLYQVVPFGAEKRALTYAVAARESLLRERIRLLHKADLKITAIDIPDFALRNICDLVGAADRGLALLLLREESGMLAVMREGDLYLVRLFNIGMNALLPYAEGMYESLSEQLEAVVLEIQRSFDYCESNFHLPAVDRLLVAQTQREIPAVVSYLDEYLAMKVEAFSFAGFLDVPDGLGQIDLNRHLLTIGGALRQEERV
jgi:MSHA biogenesis protein MshI